MRIPYSEKDLTATAPSLPLKRFFPSKGPVSISKIIPERTSSWTDADFPFTLTTPESAERVLLIDRIKLAKLIEKRGKDIPWCQGFRIELDVAGKAEEVSVEIDYIPSSIILETRGTDYEPSLPDINLTQTISGNRELGIYRVSEEFDPHQPSFQLTLYAEDGSIVKPGNDGFDFLQLGGQDPLAGRLLQDVSCRLTFPELKQGIYPLTVAARYLAEERIRKIHVFYERPDGETASTEIKLEELPKVPKIEWQPLISADGVSKTKDGVALDFQPQNTLIGTLPVLVLDYLGEGFGLKGELINGSGQDLKPFSIRKGRPGVNLLQSSLENFDQRKRERPFLLSDTPEALEPDSQGKKRKLAYRYDIPIELNMDLIDFTQSTSGDIELEVAVTLESAPTKTIIVTVRGEAETKLAGVPSPSASIQRRIRLEDTSPSESLEHLSLRNAGTLSHGKEISLRLSEIVLIDTLTGRESQDWQLKISIDGNYFDPPAGNVYFMAPERPLPPRGTAEVRFRVLPRRRLSSRIPPAQLELRYVLEHFIHERDVEKNHFREADQSDIHALRRVVRIELSPVVLKTFISVDLGTSAIVAAATHERAGDFSFEFLDLQKRLEELRNMAGYDYNADTQIEAGTPFIASNILLRNDKWVDKPNLADSCINLAPPPSVIFLQRDVWLPNLKMMFGKGGIPKLKKAFGEYFTYHTSAETNISIPADGEEVINQALHTLVHLMLEGFIRPQAGITRHEDNQLEVVFTVPNNFSQQYRDTISKWAYQTRSETHPGLNVHFIPESDAVAYSYLDLWESLHPEGDRDRPETILTYDIGAGTLDMSLLQRRLNPINHKEQELLVLGRIGLPKAGNYLDYILATVVWRLYGPESLRPLFINIRPFVSQVDLAEVTEFHSWVRNELKPAVSEVTEEQWRKQYVRFPLAEGKKFVREDVVRREIDLAAIITDITFQSYLRSVTQVALEKLTRNAFSNGAPPPVDTILFSGRTIQMNCLREAVVDSIKALPEQQGHHLTEVYADKWQLPNLGSAPTKLKGLVALGGLRYLRKHRQADEYGHRVSNKESIIDAAYGLFFNASQTAIPEYRYVELLHPAQRVVAEKKYVTQDFNLGSARCLHLVQTYEHDGEAIARSYDNGVFSGDFTIDLLDGEPIYPREKGIPVSQITQASVLIHPGVGLSFQLLTDDGRMIERSVANYRRGYNPKSPEATQSLWPFVID